MFHEQHLAQTQCTCQMSNPHASCTPRHKYFFYGVKGEMYGKEIPNLLIHRTILRGIKKLKALSPALNLQII